MADPYAEYAQSATDAAAATPAPYVDPYTEPAADPSIDVSNTGTGADYEGEGGGWPSRGGGYLSSSGILAPYHKKLIDGLYAGGRINY